MGTPQPPRKSHTARNVILICAGAFVVLIAMFAVGAAVSSKSKGGTGAAVATPTPAATQVATPAATPSPNGTYQGSCDYTLGNSPDAQNWLVGEVDVTNTGNIGTIVKALISWPQEGYPPISARQTVHVAAGATVPVRFHVPAGSITSGSNVISLLQSYQSSHSGNGCTYGATITSTYGQPS